MSSEYNSREIESLIFNHRYLKIKKKFVFFEKKSAKKINFSFLILVCQSPDYSYS